MTVNEKRFNVRPEYVEKMIDQKDWNGLLEMGYSDLIEKYKPKQEQSRIEKLIIEKSNQTEPNKKAVIEQEIKHVAISNFFKEVRENNRPRDEVNKELMKHLKPQEVKEVVKSLNQAIKSIESKTSPELER